jgi:hypothetical protein
MKPANHCDDWPFARRALKSTRHMGLASGIDGVHDFCARRGGPEACTVGPDIRKERAPVWGAYSGLEQVVPKFKAVTATKLFGQPPDIVAAVKRGLVLDRARMGLHIWCVPRAKAV